MSQNPTAIISQSAAKVMKVYSDDENNAVPYGRQTDTGGGFGWQRVLSVRQLLAIKNTIDSSNGSGNAPHSNPQPTSFTVGPMQRAPFGNTLGVHKMSDVFATAALSLHQNRWPHTAFGGDFMPSA